MNKQFKPLNSGEVLSVGKSGQLMMGHGTFRVQEFMNALREQMIQHGFGSVSNDKAQWFTEEGIDCEVLQFGSNGWQKGSVRLYLEFSPDEQGVTPVTPVTKKISETPSPAKPQTPPPGPAVEEIIAQTEATAAATAAVEVAVAQEDLIGFHDDFEGAPDLDFEVPQKEEEIIGDALGDDFGVDFEEDNLGLDDSLGDEPSEEINFEDNLSNQNDFDFEDDLNGDDLGEDFGGDLSGELSNQSLGEQDFALDDDDDFDLGTNTGGEGLGLGDVFGTDDEALDLNLGDDAMDDVWGEMEEL